MVQHTSNDELLQLKKRARRRLVGAIALVLVAVTVLWNVLDSEPKTAVQHVGAQNVEIVSNAPQLRTEPAPDLAARPSPLENNDPAAMVPVLPTPVPEPAKTKPAVPATVDGSRPVESTPAQAETKPSPKPQESLHEQVEAKKPAKVEAPKPKKEPVESKEPKSEVKKTDAGSVKADTKGSVAIQVAALSEDNKAKQLASKLQQAGMPAYAEAKGPLTRVRAGPFANRQQAENALEKLKSLGYSGVIVPR
ncbi:SPOR domain-containing protein [Chitinivorax sp. B]|uniref:SPOR domain-containing protein n=1 Tax=Chitinivorax sp. B TaxID=2502235 RepID=UPI0010F663DE|nr:SPOR domain-containing protein [Chitinivorax sp. B]